jgi:ABC-type Fe3+-hydroxamate transport system substrate-binding protein
MLHRRTVVIATAAVVLLAAACGSGTEPAPSSRESAGARSQNGRVVVLDPGITEVFIELQIVDRMVGRPQYTDHLGPVIDVPVMGTGITPNYEGIVRADPDLILTTSSRGTALRDLENIAPTHNFPWLSVAEVAKGVRAIGSLMDQWTPADALAERIEQGLASTTTPQSPSVLVLLGPPSDNSTELWYAKPISLHGAALEAAGGINAVTQAFDGPPSLSIEGLLKIDPDIILIMTPNATAEYLVQQRAFWKRFPMLTAVKRDRIGFLTGREHFSTGPGVIAFKRALSKQITALTGTTR